MLAAGLNMHTISINIALISYYWCKYPHDFHYLRAILTIWMVICVFHVVDFYICMRFYFATEVAQRFALWIS